MIPYHENSLHLQDTFQTSKISCTKPTINKVNSSSAFNSRDSEWLTLEVCREFIRGCCPREEFTCRYAHPPKNIPNSNDRVICCYDYIKGRCYRYQPACKYMHPPNHLKEQLLQNGKVNLILRNMQSVVPSNPKGTNFPKTYSKDNNNWTPVAVSREYRVSPVVDSSAINNIRSVPYMPNLPYIFIPTPDSPIIRNTFRPNLSFENLTPNSNPCQKCTHIINYIMASPQGFRDSILIQRLPMPQLFFNNTYGYNNQMLFKKGIMCTYSTMPY